MQNENVLRRVWHFFCILPSSFFILLVRLYQLVLSPAKNVLLGPSGYCRFEPSCSQYAIEAVKIHGATAGGLLAVKRICRCHPWGAHGEDPVPPFKSTVHSLSAFASGRVSQIERSAGLWPAAMGNGQKVWKYSTPSERRMLLRLTEPRSGIVATRPVASVDRPSQARNVGFL